MSYVKLPTTCQDHAVGYRTVNQATDNNTALAAHFMAKHSVGVDGFSPQGFPTRAVGRHNDILIARSVAEFAVDTAALPQPTLRAILGGPVFGSLAYARLAVGQWQIFLSTGQLYGALALLKSSSSVDRKANCYRTAPVSQGPSLIVSTWNVATATPEDLPFSLVVWTQAP